MLEQWDGLVVLASGSPRRRELLGMLFPSFEVIPSLGDERMEQTLSPWDMVEQLAAQKAREVSAGRERNLVIGADTVVAAEGSILGKPINDADAYQMLELLAGRTHQVYTGVCLRWQGREHIFHAVSDVTFLPMTREEISWYLSMGESMDKAGAYGVQGYAARFIQGIQGDFFNVMGLPVSALYEHLKSFGKGHL